MSADYTLCPACNTPRVPDRFVGLICEFCHDEGRVIQEAPINIPAKPGNRRKPVEKSSEPVQEASPEPYTPPKFDKEAAKANPAAELAARTLARRRLLPFIKRFRPKYDAGWVHEDICRRLERFLKAVEDGEEPRLLLLCPPRTGKSEIGSRHFTPWVLGQHPDWEIIAASHTTSLSLSFSRYIRDLLRDPAYHAVFPDAILDPQSQSTENWNLTEGGGYLAAGVGSAITGRGCLAPYCGVDTPSGIIPIINLKVGDEVYGYNHQHQKVVKTNVKAIQVSARTKNLLSYGNITLTTDHRIYNASCGSYTAAGESPNLLGVWREEGSTRHIMQNLLFEYKSEEQHRTDMQSLWRKVHQRESGTPEIHRSSWVRRSHILLQGLLRWIQERTPALIQQGKRAMQTLFEAHRWSWKEQVLQLRLLFSTSCKTTSSGTLQREVSSFEIQGGFQRQGLPDVWRGQRGEIRNTSCGLRCGEQYSGEFNPALHSLPPQISSVVGTSANGLADLLQVEDYVVDIQTETGNFFTCGLLVHNCHILVIDDPVKDIESADSQTQRDATWEWYISTAHSRLAPGGGVLGILTWWHEDDWAGRIQQVMAKEGDDEGFGGERFEIVKYPAINEVGDEYVLPDDTIREIPVGAPVPEGARMTREHNTAIHPARYTTQTMLRKKSNYIAAGMKRMWDALYQQNPIPDAGIFFSKEMFRLYVHTPDRTGRFIYQAWDFAITEKSTSDWTVGITLLQDEYDNLYVLDMLRFRSGDGIEICEAILDYQQQWGAQLLGFEDGQIWKSLSAQFKKRCEERKVYPTYEVLIPLTDKLVRANPLKGRMQMGKVYMPQNASWFPIMQREMLFFPAGKNDDIIDALSWCVRLTLSRSAPKMLGATQLRSWKDKLINYTEGGQGGHMAA